MTIQNKIGFVPIGGGFGIKQDKYKKLYPKDRLATFLNVDPNNEIKVKRYCSEYTFIPRDLTKGWVAGFKTEQENIKKIVEKFKFGKLEEKDIDEINKRLTRPKALAINQEQLSQINDSLGKDYSTLINEPNKIHLLKTSVHESSVASLWLDVIDYISKRETIRECKECGKFFVLENPKKQFCDDSCRDRYKKRKDYRTKNKKVM